MDIKQIPEEIICDRIVLSKYDESQAEERFEVITADYDRLKNFKSGYVGSESIKKNHETICRNNKAWESGEAFIFCILDKVSRKILGEFAFHSLSWKDMCCELGYVLFGANVGKGYVSEAVRFAETELFNIGFNRIEVRCDPQNIPSYKVAERNGYILEGTLRKNKMRNEKLCDTRVYAKLRSDL